MDNHCVLGLPNLASTAESSERKEAFFDFA